MAIRDIVPRFRGKGQTPARTVRTGSVVTLQEEMNRVFEDFFEGFGLVPSRSWADRMPAFNPRVDISETDKAVQITAELPGMEDKDISVSLDSSNNVLTISGEKKQEEEKKEAHCYRTERSYGSFYRSIPLPARVEGGKVNASFKKGVLSVVLPKLPEEKGGQKKISIRIE